jgi:sister chromatid cohesion protein PDS5
METDEEWVEDSEMSPQLRAKIMALKVFRNRCLAAAATNAKDALEIAEPVVKMFITLLQYSGSLKEDSNDE